MLPQDIFKEGLYFHHWANTAYPLTPASFNTYRKDTKQDIKAYVQKEIEQTDELCLYVHVPFCKQRCKFCEYTVLENSTDEFESEYVDLLLKEIKMYANLASNKPIVGFDLGGGTPTKLSIENLARITNALKASFTFKEGVEFSIETTPVIASNEPEKIKAVYDMGYKRISIGVQTVSEELLNKLGREGTVHVYEKAVRNIREVGYESLNIDLMYGFLNQNDADFESTLNYSIAALNPDHITLYRNRYKGTKLEGESNGVSLYKAIRQYNLAFKLLNEKGYVANPGKNTFSRTKGNYGTSDYLTTRVINGTSYIGMGLGAQSFVHNYLAYNCGAADKLLANYKTKILKGELPLQDIYDLPVEETIAKMVSVAFYFGFIDLTAFKKRFNLDFIDQFKTEVDYVLEEGLMQHRGDRIYLTQRGADYINGVIPLFYSQRAKEELFKLASKVVDVEDGEKIFLSAYKQSEFTAPSVTVDNVIFSEDNKILLIKRAEYPYMDAWALPGGFLKQNESVEEAVKRETKEETNLEIGSYEQLGIYSKAGRDPRGWIISCAFCSRVKEDVAAKFGGDSIGIKWFNLEELKEAKLAFDHKEIIEDALAKYHIES